jgi:hypothetical protein
LPGDRPDRQRRQGLFGYAGACSSSDHLKFEHAAGPPGRGRRGVRGRRYGPGAAPSEAASRRPGWRCSGFDVAAGPRGGMVIIWRIASGRGRPGRRVPAPLRWRLPVRRTDCGMRRAPAQSREVAVAAEHIGISGDAAHLGMAGNPTHGHRPDPPVQGWASKRVVASSLGVVDLRQLGVGSSVARVDVACHLRLSGDALCVGGVSAASAR